MKRNIAIVLLALTLAILIGQIVFGKYGNVFIPIVWLFVILPPILKKTAASHHLLKAIFYLATFLTLISQPIFLITQEIGSEKQLLLSFTWIVPLQIIYWFRVFGKPKAQVRQSVEVAPSSETIQNLISKNEIEQALERTSQIESLTQNQKNEVLNMSYRYEEAKRKNRLGVLSNEELKLEKNQIVTGLIELVLGLEE
ncbi:MAG: hypothetical protein AAGI38_16135 [Bacteroidota bacterium]